MPPYFTKASLMFGADPEFFITLDGRVIGSERVIPSKGLDMNHGCNPHSGTYQAPKESGTKFVRDGIQVELNPATVSCRGSGFMAYSKAFRSLKRHLDSLGQGYHMTLQQVVEVDEEEFDSLSDASKALGCKPSLNLYDSSASVGVDGKVSRQRAAGGHIHLGLKDSGLKSLAFPERLVALLDVLVGNTCVLIDRDPGAALRRRSYGRAGEYRKPSHGLEYRTLSNFWLRSVQLAGFVCQLSRLTVGVLESTLKDTSDYSAYPPTVTKAFDFEGALMSKVDMRKVIRAINENDFDLAWETWHNVVRPFIETYVQPGMNQPNRTYCTLDSIPPLYPGPDGNLDDFEYFVQKIRSSGLEYWFPADPLWHWVCQEDTHGYQWEAWLNNRVRKERLEGQR